MVKQEFKLLRASKISGKFEGWDPKAIYKFDDGSRWRLAKSKSRKAMRMRPAAKIWQDKDELIYLEVAGLAGKVLVMQVM